MLVQVLLIKLRARILLLYRPLNESVGKNILHYKHPNPKLLPVDALLWAENIYVRN